MEAATLPIRVDKSHLVTMARVVEEVKRALGRLSDRKERQKARQAIREAFRLVQRALARNPDLSPFGPVPLAEQSGGTGGGGVLPERPGPVQRELQPGAENGAIGRQDEPVPVREISPPAKPRQRKPRMRRLTPNAIVQRVRLGEAGVTCCLDHFGPDGAEAFHEGATIYINKDHPLYLRNSRRRETQTLHLARLLTQEISLMKDPRSPRQAFERQSKLLRDAFVDNDT